MDKVVFYLSDMLPNPEDQIRIFLCLILLTPIGWVMNYCVYGTTLRHLFAISLGIFLQVYMYGHMIIHVFAMFAVTFVCLNFLPRDQQHIYCMVINMGMLSCF
jgi:hypothetical protein